MATMPVHTSHAMLWIDSCHERTPYKALEAVVLHGMALGIVQVLVMAHSAAKVDNA